MNKYRQILVKYWGFTDFRELQEDIIRSVDEDGKDALGLLPTGGGKSIIFQVPALLNDGLCLVITPLIALMKDQVENLKAKKIKAAAIYSGLTRHEIDIILNNSIYGAYKFLYVSPERLTSDLFLTRLPDMKINLIAIDEAHCISQWGYDFRPAYLHIAEIRKYLPDVPVLALTATATKNVITDIQDKLKFSEKNVFRKSFERKNLVYLVREVEDKMRYLLKIVTRVNGSGIIYARNRKKTKEVAAYLQKNKISADYYHAGIDNKLKDYKQNSWKAGRTRVIVATNAFGMGIDKADVRFVVHMDLPDSLEAYYQEAGRIGRDGKQSFAVLLYHASDEGKIKKRIPTNFPEKDFIKRVYQALGNYYQLPIGAAKGRMFDFRISDFASKFKLPILQTYSALKLLENEGYLELSEEFYSSSKILFIVKQQDLYKFQVSNRKFDPFIKLLLRTYAGVFTNYINIDEEFIAKKARAKTELIFDYLQKLDQMKVIKYIPKRKLPFILYSEERLEEKNLRIGKENYEIRKENYLNRINSVLNYASSTNKCRSQILLEYFDEKDSNRCGQCDVCRRRNELELSKYEFDLILENIKPRLMEKEMSMEELINSCKFLENKLLKVISWLTENDKIILTKENKYKWK
ncbi:MAG: RecQ family ATP-dependent DNA helicase [Bacteroidetes bacterium]|nr:MAG: RecQ family ATP-dependent DNA helicase [Bacteroidota bacterium]